MNLRAKRNGVWEPLGFIDQGQIIPGIWRSVWVLADGRHVVVDTDDSAILAGTAQTARLANDAAALAREGFEGDLEIRDDTTGVWSVVCVLGVQATPMVTVAPGLALPPAAAAGWAAQKLAKRAAALGIPSSLLVQPASGSLTATIAQMQQSNWAPSKFRMIASDKPLPRWVKPDPKVPDTMGWRAWVWESGQEVLVSPHQGTGWPDAHLTAARWSEDDALRGSAGIHARRVPRHWKIVGWPDDHSSSALDSNPMLVTGLVERFGRYVMGTEGWRAEQVVIRELMAPSTEIGLKLEQRYPDAIVHYPDQIEEGDTSWTSEKSSALEKGSRSLLPFSQPAPAPPPPLSPAGTAALARIQAAFQPPQPSPPPSPKKSRHRIPFAFALLLAFLSAALMIANLAVGSYWLAALMAAAMTFNLWNAWRLKELL